MKITFIRPNMGVIKSKDALEPLGIAVLDGLTPRDIQTEFFDDRIEEIPEDLSTDLVVMSVETFSAKRSYALAEKFKKRKISIVMGGYHPSFLPTEAKHYADSIIIGEGEDTWPNLIQDFRRNELKPYYTSTNNCSLTGIHYEKRLFKDKKYPVISPLQYSRGCRFACDFCSINAFYGSTLRQRPIEDVVREIEMSKSKYFFIVDDNFYIDQEKTKALLRALIPLKIKWSTQASIDIAYDEELLSLMAKSGCINVLIGFESLDSRNLKQMGKGINLQNLNYAEAIKRIKSHGIMIYGTFVFGYDYDTADSFKQSLEFAIESKMMLANFNPLMAMPGTRLYSRMVAEKRMLHERWWLDDDFRYGDAMFVPKGMTPSELTEGCREARRGFNTYASIGVRSLDFKANAISISNFGIYMLTNFTSKVEIKNKQGAHLGSGCLQSTPSIERV